ncbi:MAG: hypothetical protein M3Y13_10220 [Armatimonadota bacterium]|nr:hypothetical protein [Armatimonadota bacterium]
MKHKRRRAGPNPLSEYRRLQREIRQVFDPFTAKHCPGCVTPCCIKPTRVTPVDVALALHTGHTFPHLDAQDAYSPALEYAGHRLALPMADAADAPAEPCEYLHQNRCTFPNDLRPYGCTAYLCGPMYAHLPDDTLRRLRRLLRQLEDAHVALLRALSDAGRLPEH